MGGKNFRGYDPTLAEDVMTIGGLLKLTSATGRIQDGNQVLNEIVVATYGSDTLGNGTWLAPYLTLAKAVSVVTSSRKTIILLPGEYSSAVSIAWPTDVTDMLITGITPDHDSTIIKCTSGAEVIKIIPGTTIGANNVLCYFASLVISATSGINGVQITDVNMTAGKKLIVTFRDCGFANDTDTDKSIVTTHTVACSIKIYLHGRGLGGNNIEGLVYIDMFNMADRLKANGMNFEGGVQFSTDDVVSEAEFYACIMKLGGGSGGQTNQLIRSDGCVSRDGMTHAAAVKGDVCTNGSYASLSLA